MNFGRLQKYYWQRPQRRREPCHPAVEGFARSKIDVIRKWVPQKNRPSILEVGAGNGYLTHYLRALGEVVAVDFSLSMLRENHCEIRTVADGLCLPFVDGTFDLVIEANLLHHVTRPLSAVREMGRVSRSIVVCIEPNRWNPLMIALGLLKAEERRTLRMCGSYLKGLIKDAGYEVVELETKGFITPNRMPIWLVNILCRIEVSSPLGAYLVAVGHRSR